MVSLLRNEVIEELRLKDYGYEVWTVDNGFYLNTQGEYLLLNGDEAHDRAQIGKYSMRTSTIWISFTK